MNKLDLSQQLRSNPYPGRGIVLGRSADGKYAVTWLRIFDRMEQVLDACDDAAGIVRAVIMKSA